MRSNWGHLVSRVLEWLTGPEHLFKLFGVLFCLGALCLWGGLLLQLQWLSILGKVLIVPFMVFMATLFVILMPLSFWFNRDDYK
jgi:hypothetical protein